MRGPRILPWAVTCLPAGAQAAAHLVNARLLDGRYGLLDAVGDDTPSSCASVAAAAVAALAAGRTALISHPVRRLVLGAMLGILAFVDAFGVHDAVGGLDPETLEAASWNAAVLAGFLLVLGTAFALLLQELSTAAARPAGLLRGGLSLLALAVGARALGAALELGATLPGALVDLGVACEQSADLAGWILIAWGLVALGGPLKKPAATSRSIGGGRRAQQSALPSSHRP